MEENTSQTPVVDDARSREILGLAWGGAAHFAELLAQEGELRGLIGPRELPKLCTRHVLNSAAVARFLPVEGSLADVGSGAGLPGVVLALMHPELEVHQVVPMPRRVEWLHVVVEVRDQDTDNRHHVRV